jgi:hypothetical protein
MPPAKRPRRSGPASPPAEPVGAAAGPPPATQPTRMSQLVHRFRGVQAREQSNAQELRSLRAKCAALEAKAERLAREKNMLRAEVATEHNSTQCRLVRLPNEVRQMLLGMLGIQALGRLATTSSCWRHSIADPAVWHILARSAGLKVLRELLVRLCARTCVGAELATICCERAQKISTRAEASAFHRLGGLRAIVATMRNHVAHAELQSKACQAVKCLANKYVQGNPALLAAGSAEAVVGAMQAHPSMAAVQEQGCLAAGNLAYQCAECKAVLLEAGGAEAVVGALRAHVDVAAVQEAGCWAASKLAYQYAEGQAALLAAGGAEAVVGALRAHVGVAGVQETGCRAAGSLAISAEGRAALLAAGGAEAVVGAIRAHVGVAGVQEQGCRAAGNLACSAETRAALRQAGVEHLARDAARTYPSHSNVQSASAKLLRRLAR